MNKDNHEISKEELYDFVKKIENGEITMSPELQRKIANRKARMKAIEEQERKQRKLLGKLW